MRNKTLEVIKIESQDSQIFELNPTTDDSIIITK